MKKAIAFILAAVMLVMLPAGAFADSAECRCDTPPVVMVNGFATDLTHDNGDGTTKSVFPMGAIGEHDVQPGRHGEDIGKILSDADRHGYSQEGYPRSVSGRK